MIFASDNDKRVKFYCIDYKGDASIGVDDSICRPTVREYDNVSDFMDDHEDVAKLYRGTDYGCLDFYEVEFGDAMRGYNLDGMVCYDEKNDLWSNLD